MGYRLCMGKSILCIDLKNQTNKRICKYQLTQEIHLNQEEHPFRVVEITLIALNPSRRGEGSAALCVSISSTPHSCRSMKPSPLVGTILYSKCQSNLSTQDLPAEKKNQTAGGFVWLILPFDRGNLKEISFKVMNFKGFWNKVIFLTDTSVILIYT